MKYRVDNSVDVWTLLGRLETIWGRRSVRGGVRVYGISWKPLLLRLCNRDDTFMLNRSESSLVNEQDLCIVEGFLYLLLQCSKNLFPVVILFLIFIQYSCVSMTSERASLPWCIFVTDGQGFVCPSHLICTKFYDDDEYRPAIDAKTICRLNNVFMC